MTNQNEINSLKARILDGIDEVNDLKMKRRELEIVITDIAIKLNIETSKGFVVDSIMKEIDALKKTARK